MFRYRIIWTVLIGCVLPVSVWAAVMQSSSYRIQSDSINIGGGLATATSYRLEDTTGEIATGNSSSTTYVLHAGYQQMQESYVSISAGTDITLPSMSGITGAMSVGSTTVLVVTDSPAGYSLSIRATATPALQSPDGYSFDDYAPAVGGADFAFVAIATTSLFGFTPEGADITAVYRDNGAVCGTGALDTPNACWDGFSTTDRAIAQSGTANHPDGTTTTIVVRAENGAAHIQEAGVYTATLEVTALAL